MSDPEEEMGGACDRDTWEIILRFDSDEVEFCRGFEAGVLYAEIAAVVGGLVEVPWSRMIHATNLEMAIRIAEYGELSIRIEENDEDEDWVEVIFDERP